MQQRKKTILAIVDPSNNGATNSEYMKNVEKEFEENKADDGYDTPIMEMGSDGKDGGWFGGFHIHPISGLVDNSTYYSQRNTPMTPLHEHASPFEIAVVVCHAV